MVLQIVCISIIIIVSLIAFVINLVEEDKFNRNIALMAALSSIGHLVHLISHLGE